MSYCPKGQREEVEELAEVFGDCLHRVAVALELEQDLADPLDGMRMVGDALHTLTADLRYWHREHAGPGNRRVSPAAAADLAAMVHGDGAA